MKVLGVPLTVNPQVQVIDPRSERYGQYGSVEDKSGPFCAVLFPDMSRTHDVEVLDADQLQFIDVEYVRRQLIPPRSSLLSLATGLSATSDVKNGQGAR